MMQGSQGPSSIELAFNFSDYAARLEGMKEPKFFLNVSRNKRGNKTGEGSVSSVEVYDYRAGGAPVIYKSPDAKGLPLAFGDNIFGIPTTPLRYTPASTVAWLDKYGKPFANPFVVRTVSGRYAKLRFTGYDAVTGKVKFIYVISSGKGGLIPAMKIRKVVLSMLSAALLWPPACILRPLPSRAPSRFRPPFDLDILLAGKRQGNRHQQAAGCLRRCRLGSPQGLGHRRMRRPSPHRRRPLRFGRSRHPARHPLDLHRPPDRPIRRLRHRHPRPRPPLAS